jgi:hypothetical protein
MMREKMNDVKPKQYKNDIEIIFGEELDFSIDLLLDNSENLGETRFAVPDLPLPVVKNAKFIDLYYREFYSRLIDIFKEF